jgi:hypothetical protein
MTHYEDLSDEHQEKVDQTLEKIEDHLEEALDLHEEMAEVTNIYTGQDLETEKEVQAIEYCKEVLKKAAKDENNQVSIQKVLGMADQVKGELEREITMDKAENLGDALEQAISEMTGGEIEVEATPQDVIEVKDGETEEDAIRRWMEKKEREESDHYE